MNHACEEQTLHYAAAEQKLLQLSEDARGRLPCAKEITSFAPAISFFVATMTGSSVARTL